jgi:hypothetical protein
MEDLKKLREISKEILEKEHHKKINSLCCVEDKRDAIKFLMISHLKMRHLEILDLLEESEDHEDFYVLSLKTKIIPSKIIFLQENFEEKGFKKILTLLEEIELRLLNNGFI